MKPQRATPFIVLTLLTLVTFANSTEAQAENKLSVQEQQLSKTGDDPLISKSCSFLGHEKIYFCNEYSQQNAQIAAKRGDLKATNHNFVAAIADYTEAIKINPTFARPNAPDEDFFFRNTNIDKLQIDCAHFLESEPNNPYALAISGELKFMKSDDVGAKADFDKAIANQSDLFFALVRRADLVHRTDNGSLADCNEALKWYPACARLHHDKGIAYIDRHEFDLATEEFGKASLLDPKWSRPYFMLAQVYLQKGNKTKALDYFEECLRYEKSWSYVYLAQAAIWIDIHNYERAIKNYDRVIALSQPADPMLYWDRADAKFAFGDRLGAIADFSYYLMHDRNQVAALTAELLLLLNLQIFVLTRGAAALKRNLLMHE
ncbi:MAG: tetratricopeptide repeat protein [Candidatus Obscuribacterales bacterium]|jgi:tetratricopeptide (TPR) repeat protein